MTALRPMTDEEWARFEPAAQEDYALERARNFGTSVEEERPKSLEQWKRLLPDGVRTPGQRFWSVVDQDRVVGYLWVAVDEAEKHAFIFYIFIEEEHRGKGYGRRALDLLEAELRALGIKRIALNVFADNEVAKRLYEKQGYLVTNQNMQKAIGEESVAGPVGDRV